MARKKVKAPFRSKFEQRVAEQLEAAGIKYEYEQTVIEYDLKVHRGYCPECGHGVCYTHRDYLTDFHLPTLGYFLEVKGRFTSPDRTKMRTVIEQHPDLDIRMLFMRDNKINKKSKVHYSDWCDKHGIKYAIGGIPEDWLDAH